MALRVLDGNQTATTLSSVVTGGEHIVAHSVVSLGANAIANIASAVSGSVVSISNFPSTQTVAGTVTAGNIPVFLEGLGDAPCVRVGGVGVDGAVLSEISNQVRIISSDSNSIIPISGTVTATVRQGEDAIINDPASGYTTIRAQSHWFSDSDNEVKVTSENNPLPISGTVTVGNSVTIGSLPAISGTVTANLGAYQGWSVITKGSVVVTGNSGLINMTDVPNGSIVAVRIISIPSPVVYRLDYRDVSNSTGSTITLNNSFATGSATTFGTSGNYQFRKTGNLDYARFAYDSGSSGGVLSYELYSVADIYYGIERPISGTVTIGSLPTLTPQLPRVTFIDGSGTVVTANSAVTLFASSTTRSYLLVQVTTGSAFVNVGATATTVNGINLTAGQGYAWETTIPQGLVSLISTTTSSRWVAKEA